uniref:Uncharacterized protein n=1 Tax=Panagrolaimus davidi TaxID=227884 RepID=A0A914QJU5_9BILA
MHFNVSTVFWVFVIFIYTVTCINNGCNDVPKQISQSDLEEVSNQTYGFLSNDIAVIGEEASLFWTWSQNNLEIKIEIKTIENHQTNASVYFGEGDNECKLKSGATLKNKCMCIQEFNGRYVPIKAWSTQGPVILKLKQTAYLIFNIKKNKIKLVNECPNTRKLFETTQKTYKDFRKYGEEWIGLKKEETVIWAPVSTFEHYIEIAIRHGGKLTKTETIGIEFNGQSPMGDYEKKPKNLRIFLENDLCQPFPAFFGYNRYITEKRGNGKKLPLFYLEAEQNRPLLSANHLRNFSMIYTAPTTPPLTSSKPSTTIADTSMSSLIPSSNIPTTISKSITSFNPLSPSSSTTVAPVIQTSTTTFASSSTTLNGTFANEIKSPATAAVATSMPLKAATSESEESGLSLEILIPLIIGCLLILLIIICIIVICIIRNRRRKKRQNAKNRGKQTRQKRSAIKNAFVTLVGEDEAECEGKEEEQSKSIQKSLQQQQPSTPSSLKSNPEMPLQIHLPPTEQNPSTPASSNLVPSKEQASKKPDTLLPLQQTQSIKESEKSNSFDQTARAAKYEKRDPRFPHLIPGTIEFLVAQSQFIEQDSENLQRSGTVDDSKHAQFLHDH